MRIYNEQTKQLLLHHREMGAHPIFSKPNAKENFVSLLEYLTTLGLATAAILITTHLLLINNLLFEVETLPWLVVTSSVGAMLGGIRPDLLYDKIFISGLLLVIAILLFITHSVFEVTKAKMHTY